jgi:hypothetical protein
MAAYFKNQGYLLTRLVEKFDIQLQLKSKPKLAATAKEHDTPVGVL